MDVLLTELGVTYATSTGRDPAELDLLSSELYVSSTLSTRYCTAFLQLERYQSSQPRFF